MKNAKLLSKAEMKNVTGGLSGVCGNWSNSGYDVCFNCCVSWADQQPNPDSDPHGIGNCDSICSR